MTAETDVTVPERDERGRWAAGNKGALGARGNAGWMRAIRQSFQDVATPERMRAVWEGIFTEAERGEPWACALVTRYTGAPPEPEQLQEVDMRAELLASLKEKQERWLARPGLAEAMARAEKAEAELERLRALHPPPLPEPAPAPPAPRRERPRDVEAEVREPRPVPALPAHEPDAEEERARRIEEMFGSEGWQPL
jgi:hypothetical protein